MKNKWLRFSVISLTMLSIATISIKGRIASADQYIVQSNDTLSEIVSRTMPGPVYGQGGNLSKVVALNPNLRNPNLIYPAERIKTSNEVEHNETGLTVALAQPCQSADTSAKTQQNNCKKISAGASEINDKNVGATTTETKAVQRKAISDWTIAPNFYFSYFNITDKGSGATARLVSNSNVGFDSNFFYGLGQSSWSAVLHFELSHISLKSPSSSTLLDTDFTTYSLTGGLAYQFNPDGKFGILFGMDREVYSEGVAINQFSLNGLTVPRLSLFADYTFLSHGLFTVGALGMFDLDLAGTGDIYQTDVNADFLGRIYFKQTLSSKVRLEFDINAKTEAQNTSLVDQRQTDYGIGVGITIPLGGDF